jgi:hypothetical protein
MTIVKSKLIAALVAAEWALATAALALFAATVPGQADTVTQFFYIGSNYTTDTDISDWGCG